MAQVFAIQILGYGNDFVLGRPASIIMWDENLGAVEIFYPIPPDSYTVFKYGDTAMRAARIISLNYGVNRIVSSSDRYLRPTNEDRGYIPRTFSINFTMRQLGSGGAAGIFYNYSINQFQTALFTQTYGNTVYNKSNSKDARNQAFISTGTFCDLFQSNY